MGLTLKYASVLKLKETAEYSKTKTEYYILKALEGAAYQRATGGALTFEELRNGLQDHIGSTSTLTKGLERLQEKKCVKKEFVKRLVREKEKDVPAYRILTQAQTAFPEFIWTRQHYEKLINRVDLDASPSKFLLMVRETVARIFVDTWIRGRWDKKPIDDFKLMQMMNDFDFLIRKYVFYRSHPKARDLGKADEKTLRVLADISKVSVDEKPYRKVFDKLLRAVSSRNVSGSQ
jgi:DNA-binding HxlR family transcriptional regulator